MEKQVLPIDQLRIDADTQARVKVSEETVDDYAELISSSVKKWPLGDLDIFHDGTDYFVADGFHRTLAAQRSKRVSVPCRIHKGTAKDARIFGMTANDRHGLRMSRADKRNCVEWLLDNGGKMTQAEIAEKAGVCVRTVKTAVAARRPEKVQVAPFEEPEPKEEWPLVPASSMLPAEPEASEGQADSVERAGQAPPDDDAGPFDEIEESESTPETTSKNGTSRESVSAASLVDKLTKQHVGHIARGLTAIAQTNGGEGPQFKEADAGLNQMILALQKMREGQQ